MPDIVIMASASEKSVPTDHALTFTVVLGHRGRHVNLLGYNPTGLTSLICSANAQRVSDLFATDRATNAARLPPPASPCFHLGSTKNLRLHHADGYF